MLGAAVRRLASPLHQWLRGQKVELALSVVGESPGTLLDLGGGPGFGGEFAPLLRRFRYVTCVNLDAGALGQSREHNPVQGDACRLPFKDGAFDWVFCNAMLEHVGGWGRISARPLQRCGGSAGAATSSRPRTGSFRLSRTR